MKIKSSSGGGKFAPVQVEEGSHVGTLVKVVDLGLQDRGEWKGQKLSDAPLLGLTFELPHLFVDDDESRPVHLYKEVTQFNNPKSTLHTFAKALLGGTAKVESELESHIDLAKLLGKSALVTVGRTSTGRAKITGLSPLVKGMTVPEPKTELVLFDLDCHTKEDLEALPAFIQAKIAARLDGKSSASPDSDEVEF